MLGEVRKTGKLNSKLLPDILSAKLALDLEQPANDRLAAMQASAHLLSPQHIRTVLSALAIPPMENLDKIDSTEIWTAQNWGEAYLALNGNPGGNPGGNPNMDMQANLLASLLVQANKNGVLLPIARALESEILSIPVETRAKYKADVFASLAVHKRDIGTLRALYLALSDDDPLRSRIALASDALGGGFLLGDLGVDIETRLAEPTTQARAVRDSYIAVALGANLSDAARDVLVQTKLKGRAVNPGDILSLQETARRGAKAELALRAAKIFGEIAPDKMRPDSFAAILSAMTGAGMNNMAGQLAAQDFLGPGL